MADEFSIVEIVDDAALNVEFDDEVESFFREGATLHRTFVDFVNDGLGPFRNDVWDCGHAGLFCTKWAQRERIYHETGRVEWNICGTFLCVNWPFGVW